MIFVNPLASLFYGFLAAMALLYLGSAGGGGVAIIWLLCSFVATVIMVAVHLIVRGPLFAALGPGAMTWRLLAYLFVLALILHRMMEVGARLYALFVVAGFAGMCLRLLWDVWRLILLTNKPPAPGVPYHAQ